MDEGFRIRPGSCYDRRIAEFRAWRAKGRRGKPLRPEIQAMFELPTVRSEGT